jgi:hypothetical protein
MIKTKYNKEFSSEDWNLYLKKIKNDVFKLLPLREENLDWKKHLQTILIELSGLNNLINEYKLIGIMSKLESLYNLEEFYLYRKTIFEILSALDGLE